MYTNQPDCRIIYNFGCHDMTMPMIVVVELVLFFFQAEDGIRDIGVTGVQTCALPISRNLAAVRCSSKKRVSIRPARSRRAGCPPRCHATSSWGRRNLQFPRRGTRGLRLRVIGLEIGKGSCRGRVENLVGALSLKKKN